MDCAALADAGGAGGRTCVLGATGDVDRRTYVVGSSSGLRYDSTVLESTVLEYARVLVGKIYRPSS